MYTEINDVLKNFSIVLKGEELEIQVSATVTNVAGVLKVNLIEVSNSSIYVKREGRWHAYRYPGAEGLHRISHKTIAIIEELSIKAAREDLTNEWLNDF